MYFQKRDKFFYAVPYLFPKWDYPSRLAIGVKLADARYRNDKYFRFLIKGVMYQITKEKAEELGNKYVMAGGTLPNLLPKEEFKVLPYSEPEFYD